MSAASSGSANAERRRAAAGRPPPPPLAAGRRSRSRGDLGPTSFRPDPAGQRSISAGSSRASSASFGSDASRRKARDGASCRGGPRGGRPGQRCASSGRQRPARPLSEARRPAPPQPPPQAAPRPTRPHKDASPCTSRAFRARTATPTRRARRSGSGRCGTDEEIGEEPPLPRPGEDFPFWEPHGVENPFARTSSGLKCVFCEKVIREGGESAHVASAKHVKFARQGWHSYWRFREEGPDLWRDGIEVKGGKFECKICGAKNQEWWMLYGWGVGQKDHVDLDRHTKAALNNPRREQAMPWEERRHSLWDVLLQQAAMNISRRGHPWSPVPTRPKRAVENKARRIQRARRAQKAQMAQRGQRAQKARRAQRAQRAPRAQRAQRAPAGLRGLRGPRGPPARRQRAPRGAPAGLRWHVGPRGLRGPRGLVGGAQRAQRARRAQRAQKARRVRGAQRAQRARGPPQGPRRDQRART